MESSKPTCSGLTKGDYEELAASLISSNSTPGRNGSFTVIDVVHTSHSKSGGDFEITRLGKAANNSVLRLKLCFSCKIIAIVFLSATATLAVIAAILFILSGSFFAAIPIAICIACLLMVLWVSKKL